MLPPCGQTLVDSKSGEARFCPIEPLAQGQRHDLMLAEDTHLERKLVCIKSARHPRGASAQQVRDARERLARELRTLTLPSPLLPEPLDWLSVHNPELGAELAPGEVVLVYEHQPGRALNEKMLDAPQGLEPQHALALARELLLLARCAHERGLVLCGLRPEHVILGVDDTLHVVGWGSATPIGERAELDACAYTAPELSEQVAAPSADLYSIGTLLWLLCTGREAGGPIWPFERAALRALPAGVARLLVALAHPQPAHRLESVEQALALWTPGRLPDASHPLLRERELEPKQAAILVSPAPPASPSSVAAEATTLAPAASGAPPVARSATELAAHRWRMAAWGVSIAAVLSIVVLLLALLGR